MSSQSCFRPVASVLSPSGPWHERFDILAPRSHETSADRRSTARRGCHDGAAWAAGGAEAWVSPAPSAAPELPYRDYSTDRPPARFRVLRVCPSILDRE